MKYETTLAVASCDVCGFKGIGGMLNCEGTPVLFTCQECDPASFWAALATEWQHVDLFLDVYMNVVEMSTDLYMDRLSERYYRSEVL